ncbi:MAG TPA: hypothetical protein ENG12_05660 [Candidatus Altiarchaeales archaeon]|nr:hypothetical protein [Candidatus Altiarchaeales archaeon]
MAEEDSLEEEYTEGYDRFGKKKEGEMGEAPERPEEEAEEVLEELPEERGGEAEVLEELLEEPPEELPGEEKSVEHRGEVKVILHVREGEYAPVGRFEFPNNDIIFELLTSSFPREKKYKFHHFNNVLVSKNYSEEVEKFLIDEARRLGYTLKIERR